MYDIKLTRDELIKIRGEDMVIKFEKSGNGIEILNDLHLLTRHYDGYWNHNNIKYYEELYDRTINKLNELGLKKWEVSLNSKEYHMEEIRRYGWNCLIDPNRVKRGFVYFITDSNGFTKIGKTINIMSRMKRYITENSQEVSLIKSIAYEDYTEGEFYWHNKYKEKRIRGERFMLTEEDINFIISQ